MIKYVCFYDSRVHGTFKYCMVMMWSIAIAVALVTLVALCIRGKNPTWKIITIEGINIKILYYRNCFAASTFLFQQIFTIVFKHLYISFWWSVDVSNNEISGFTLMISTENVYISLLKILISILNLNSSCLCI